MRVSGDSFKTVGMTWVITAEVLGKIQIRPVFVKFDVFEIDLDDSPTEKRASYGATTNRSERCW
jgi:hypothetical protein